MNLEERGRKAIIRYLKLKDYDVIDENFDDFVVATNEDVIHFVDIIVSDKLEKDLFSKLNKSRDDFEQAMCKWLASHDEFVDVSVCSDICNLVVLGSDRAFIRHYVNVQEGL